MRSPMFMPLQPRFVSSSIITLILTVFSFISLIPHFTHPTDADSIGHDDHNHPRIRDLQDQSGVSGTPDLMREEGSRSYEPTFTGLDRSILGRALDIKDLQINNPATDDIKMGETHSWKVQSSDARSLNLTLSICNISSTGNDEPPALRLKISEPPLASQSSNITTDKGIAVKQLNMTREIEFSVSVDDSSEFKGTYSYELTASTGVLNASLTLLDSDNNSTLFAVDTNFSLLPDSVAFGISVYPNDSLIPWIPKSNCALKNLANINGNSYPSAANVTTEMTNVSGRTTKQLFHVTGLNPGTSYLAIIAIDRNKTQGVTDSEFDVFTPIPFMTKSNSNCAVIYNLSFCTDTAYAVPYNPKSNLTLSALTSFYDIQAESLYNNFNFSLQQIPCNTTSSAQYSLARNCTSCAIAYKSWLCAVTIPRCQDYSASDDRLHRRSTSQPFWNDTIPDWVTKDDPASNRSNQTCKSMSFSRNPMIDQIIKPGPWKEVLPCKDLCYNLVQSCPAALGFACPAGKWLEHSYGNGSLCNDPTRRPNSAGRQVGTNILGAMAAFGLVLMLQLGGHY